MPAAIEPLRRFSIMTPAAMSAFDSKRRSGISACSWTTERPRKGLVERDVVTKTGLLVKVHCHCLEIDAKGRVRVADRFKTTPWLRPPALHRTEIRRRAADDRPPDRRRPGDRAPGQDRPARGHSVASTASGVACRPQARTPSCSDHAGRQTLLGKRLRKLDQESCDDRRLAALLGARTAQGGGQAPGRSGLLST